MTMKGIYRPCTYVTDVASERRCGSQIPIETWLVYVSDGDYGDKYPRKEPLVRCKKHLAPTVDIFAQNNDDVGYLDRVVRVFEDTQQQGGKP